jgi:hypothetical protein
MSVLSQTPTINSHLTSILYRDNQVALTAKLALLNTFTANQVISVDLKADKVVVINTTPTLDTQLTSKLYVDTALATSSQTLQTQSTSQSQDKIAFEQLTSTHTSDIFALQVGKKIFYEAGTGIDIQLQLLLLLVFVLLRVKIQILILV